MLLLLFVLFLVGGFVAYKSHYIEIGLESLRHRHGRIPGKEDDETLTPEEIKRRNIIKGNIMILEELHRGVSSTRVKQIIASKGWPADSVDKMIKLEYFIRYSLVKRIPPKEIVLTLEKSGWPREVIIYILKHLRTWKKL